MPNIRDSLWRGRELTSLEQMQAEAERWWQRIVQDAAPLAPRGRP